MPKLAFISDIPEKFEAKNAAAIKWCENKEMHFRVLYEEDLEK